MATAMYLEHCLDNLENLPCELRRNFNLLRDLDQRTQELLSEIKDISDDYLVNVRNMAPETRTEKLKNIKKLFSKSRHYGDDKVQLANQTYEMVDKHIRRLDADLTRFEAEVRSANILRGGAGTDQSGDEEEGDHSNSTSAANKSSKDKKRKGDKASSSSTGGENRKRSAAAASGVSSSGPGPSSTEEDDTDTNPKSKKRRRIQAPPSPEGGSSSAPDQLSSMMAPFLGINNRDVLDMPVDPNEPTYCLCHQVSYGEMIGCDNNDCQIEWFHFGCVNLSSKPKGKWFCPRCNEERTTGKKKHAL